MNVTDQRLAAHLIYGGSDNTNPAGLSASYSLNYAKGGSITNPDVSPVITHIPFTFTWKDAVGLFGAENHYHKITMRVDGVSGCLEPPGWECANLEFKDFDAALPGGQNWDPLLINFNADLVPQFQGYEPARVNKDLPNFRCPKVGVTLNNVGTGNTHVDSWLDVRLYTQEKEEHPYPVMWVPPAGHFYVGFHARNTRRLPYHVEVKIGEAYMPATEVDKKFIA